MKCAGKKGLLDPGHGGTDNGADRNGVYEDEQNLLICRAAADILRLSGYSILLTRDRDESLSLSDRLAMIRDYQPDFFVSVHCNASTNPKARGVEVFYRDDYDIPLAQSLYRYLHAMTGMRGRGVFQDIGDLKKRLTVLNDLKTPAALVEVGFLSDTYDRNYIAGNTDTLGELIAWGAMDFCQDAALQRELDEKLGGRTHT